MAVARPADAREVAALLVWAGEEGVSVTPRGGATAMPGGNVGRGVILDLMSSPFQRISPPEVESRTIRVGPGAVAATVEMEARKAGFTLPPLPSSASRCTIGGMVGTNAAGARSFRHGAVRDWVRELEVALPDGTVRRVGGDPGGVGRAEACGEVIPGLSLLPLEASGVPEGWPRVVKNSSGYALDRYLAGGGLIHLLVGSEGTLGVVTEVTLRLAPAPQASGVLLLPLPSLEFVAPGVELARRLDATACEFLGRRLLEMAGPGISELLPPSRPPPEALLLLEFQGEVEVVEAAIQEAEGELGRGGITPLVARSPANQAALWGIRHRASPAIQAAVARGLRSTQVIEDSVVPPKSLPAYLRGVEEILGGRGVDHVIFGHAGDGNLHVNPLFDPSTPGIRDAVAEILGDTAALVAELGGTLAGEHGDGRVRAPLLETIWAAPLVEAFRAVKEHFDPAAVLNPGVILPLPGQDPLEGLWGGPP